MAFGGLHKKQSDINNLFTLLKDSLAISENVDGLLFTISNLLNDLVWICDKQKETIFGNKLFKEVFLNKIELKESSKYNIGDMFGNKLDLFFLQKECLGQISIDVDDRKYLLSIISNLVECGKNEYFIFYAELNEVEDRSVFDQKEEYRALWELSNNCLRIVDENGFIIDINQNFCNLVNKSRSELIGNYYDSVYLTPHAKPINFLRNFNHRLETVVTLWNGEVYYLDIRSKIITYKSGQKAVVSIIRNITYMRETENKLFNVEQQFNETAELIPQVFFEADKNGVITYCNSYAYKMFNVAESVNEKEFNILSFISPESKEKAINNFNYRLNNKKITSNEYVVQTSKGQKIPVLIYSAPLIRNGEIEGLRGIIIDISEQKKLEETVRKSEYLYRTIVNTSPDGISLMDINGQIIFANDKKAELFGYKSGNDLVGVNAFNLVSEESAFLLNESYFGLLKTSKIDKILLKLKRKDNSTFWGEFRAKLIYDNNGKPNNIMDIVTDVSEKLIAEEERKLNQLRTETLLKVYQMSEYEDSEITAFLLREAVKQTDSDGGYLLFFNEDEDIENTIIYYKDNFIKVNNNEKQIKFDKTDLPLWLYPLKIKDKIVFNDYSDIYYKQVTLPNLDVTIKRIVAIPIFNNNKIGLIAGLINKKHSYTDLDTKQFMLMMNSLNTALEKFKNDENLRIFKKAIEQNPTIILITGADRIIKYANPKFTEITGFALNDVLGKSTAELGIFPYLNENNLSKSAKNMLKEGGEWQGEIEFKKAGGDFCWLLLYISPMTNEKGQITNYIGIAQDITDRKNIDKQLIEAKEIAEKSDRLKSEFLAQMSHEIRTPINVILSFMGLIKDELDEYLDEDLKSSFVSVNRAGSRLIRTIDLLLNMSELQTGTYDYNPDFINLDRDILQPLITENIYGAKSKGLNLEYENKIEDSIIFGDNYSVYQIFSNLVDNAIKFTNKGGIKLTLYNEEGKIICCVQDSGVGISEEYLPILFTPFSQEQQGYTRSFEGNGLGLAIVKKYCELNGADITCNSKKGEGSCFKVSFTK